MGLRGHIRCGVITRRSLWDEAVTPMDLFGRDHVELGLRRYAEAVASALGVGPEATCCEFDSSASAYIALTDPLPGFPDRDVALLWDDTHGWSLCVETHSGEDLILLAYLATTVLPEPETVAACVAEIRACDEIPTPRLPPAYASSELREGLLDYAW